MTLATLTRPTTGDDLSDNFDDHYLFLIGTVIVGRTSADCWVCAWKEGYRQWPTSKMAVVLEFPESEYLEPCLHGPQRGKWFFYEGNVVVVRPPGADCCNCAWKQGRQHAPLAGFAMDIPCEPGHANVECRRELRRRRAR